MAVTRNSLRGFLAQARSALRTAIDSRQRITIVIGNESADLDSMTSPVLFAYVQSLCPPRNAFTPIYVPVINIPASDLALRPEFSPVLQRANINAAHLLTLDDLPEFSVIQDKLPPENTKWILMDHNALQGPLGKMYSGRVGGVIDHHDDEGTVPADTTPEPRIIERSGSCTSLVTEYCQQRWDVAALSALSSGAAHGQGDSVSEDGATRTLWDAQVAQLGLASILVDTVNLESADKTTDHDSKAVKYLELKIISCPQVASGYDRGRYYKEIDAAKSDFGHLKLHDILRKDYKQWTENGVHLGVSSVVKPLDFLVQKAGSEQNGLGGEEALLESLRSFAQERKLSMYALMTAFSTSANPAFQRELLVWGISGVGISGAKRFASRAQEELGLEDWHFEGVKHPWQARGDEWLGVWRQRQVQHSRKRVAPLLRQALI
ncbi:DHH phosphoesterase [Sporormia fimetaria CBS 119925]|uniref:DHH phosphoesterase n=1 Tax=Sporormia fimetaria CBS 119925 TaxID=1340428 RepID=A0A6A6V0H4_9PLEO|nr:DHH phosphoesterase [Sporormia fimetaria CBS 119925]